MKYRVTHITQYEYSAPVTLCYNIAHLLPGNTPLQRCHQQRISVTPEPVYQKQGQDYFGNGTLYFSIQEPHQKLTIEVVTELDRHSVSDLHVLRQCPLTCGELRQQLKQANDTELRLVSEFCLNSPLIKRSAALVTLTESLFEDDQPVIEAVWRLTEKIFDEFTFDPTATTVTTPTDQVVRDKRGVCQDFAHVAIACLRSVGLPARYISGYIETLPPPGKEKLVGADASHAWFAVFVPGVGWIEFDPTNNVMPGEQHIVTAWGRDYSDVTPLQGVIFEGGDSNTLTVSVDVARLL